ncbi:hypothetical protein OROGR_027537 [Orobanche gracilis]
MGGVISTVVSKGVAVLASGVVAGMSAWVVKKLAEFAMKMFARAAAVAAGSVSATKM